MTLWLRSGRVSGAFSAREADEIKRRLADRDLDVKPRTSKRSTANSLTRADWERIGIALQKWLRS
jgi:hypothetical protein